MDNRRAAPWGALPGPAWRNVVERLPDQPCLLEARRACRALSDLVARFGHVGVVDVERLPADASRTRGLGRALTLRVALNKQRNRGEVLALVERVREAKERGHVFVCEAGRSSRLLGAVLPKGSVVRKLVLESTTTSEFANLASAVDARVGCIECSDATDSALVRLLQRTGATSALVHVPYQLDLSCLAHLEHVRLSGLADEYSLAPLADIPHLHLDHFVVNELPVMRNANLTLKRCRGRMDLSNLEYSRVRSLTIDSFLRTVIDVAPVGRMAQPLARATLRMINLSCTVDELKTTLGSIPTALLDRACMENKIYSGSPSDPSCLDSNGRGLFAFLHPLELHLVAVGGFW